MTKSEDPKVTIPTHINLTNLRIGGFAAANAYAGEKMTPVVVRAALTSDDPEFYPYMNSVSNVLSGRVRNAGAHLALDRASSLLLVTHPDDGSVDLYVHEFPMAIEILAKQDIIAGEAVYRSKVADVRRVRFPGVKLGAKDGLLVCFKVGWKFALFFDLAPNRDLDVDALECSIALLYRRLSFEDAYAALGNPQLFEKLLHAGWFPFVEIIGGEFGKLFNAHKQDFNVTGEEDILLKKFNADRIDAIAKRWWNRPCLTPRKKILESALDAFKRGDSVACLKTVLTEMEGVIRDTHIAELGRGASIKNLLKYAAERGVTKSGDDTSLLFPNQFLEYLNNYTFANFDPMNVAASDGASRHTIGHGAAPADAYTQTRALQAILTLDQIAFYL